MKAFIVFMCIVGVAVAETCDGTDTTKCASEVCATNFVPTCQTGICTCNPTPDPAACTQVSDCGQYWFSHHCNTHQRQCLNSKCQCVHGNSNGHHG